MNHLISRSYNQALSDKKCPKTQKGPHLSAHNKLIQMKLTLKTVRGLKNKKRGLAALVLPSVVITVTK